MADRIKDSALIAAAQRVEHYEIAGYGCVRAYAATLGDANATNLLAETLKDEKEADRTLNRIAEELNLQVPLELEEDRSQKPIVGNIKAFHRKTRSAA
jgi:ferritin-like metal-binding protein YciE